jgi:hypothetical protein
MAHVRVPVMRRWLTTENIYALALCLILIFLIVLTAEQAPQWIYQGF